MSASSSAGQTARPKANVSTQLLEPVAIFMAPGAREFIVKERFVVDTSDNARVRISWLGPNLKANFLDRTGSNVVDGELKLRKLKRPSLDGPIVAELGAKEKAEINLCEFYETLAYKEAVHDLTWVIGYVVDAEGILWTVFALWLADNGGWYIEVNFFDDPSGWSANRQIVSH